MWAILNEQTGIYVCGSDLTIDATLVRANGLSGLSVEETTGTPHRANAVVRQSVMAENVRHNMFVSGSDLTIDATILRDSDPAGVMTWSCGLCVQDDEVNGGRSLVSVTASLWERSRGVGISLMGSDGFIERTIVRDTLPFMVSQQFGRGINIQWGADWEVQGTAAIRQCIVESSYEVGVYVGQSQVTIEQTRIRTVQPQLSTGIAGDGIVLEGTGSALTLLDGRIEDCARVGVANFSAAVTMGSNLFECNAIHLNGETLNGPYGFEDLGGNLCGCDGQAGACQVLSSGVAAPAPLGPE